ncbi:hypothetical protein INT44_003612 [Umbelopsis vinacea]|uniref:Uncharacterized protein n=1 Tax=Umbelopsis vinacea TaxID=44442 RepID=A0A8H7UI16_9FUNG|nr:hypothetical protein INT44_003612 [Umbelopsis vinacea]
MSFALIPIDRVIQEGQAVISGAQDVTPDLPKKTIILIDDRSTVVDHLPTTAIITRSGEIVKYHPHLHRLHTIEKTRSTTTIITIIHIIHILHATTMMKLIPGIPQFD